MTSPAQPAPNGYMADGTPSASIDDTRDDMIKQFDDKTSPLSDNTKYYDAERRPDAIGIAVPPAMQKLLAHVGYPRLYVDSIAERLSLEGFQLGGADEADDQLWDWWQANDLDIESTLGHTDGLMHGRSYITIAAPDPTVDLFVDPTVPIIRVEPPTNLYAKIDTRTRQVTQAIRVIKSDDGSSVTAATLYLPLQTVAWLKQGSDWAVLQTIPHNLGIVPVVPLSNRVRLSDLYGTSAITPELRSITDAAARILMNMQGAAELMGTPQRILFGVKPQDIGVDAATGQAQYDAYMARILAFADPEGKAFQFSAAELRNFTDALDAIDRKAAAYTGLPPQYLSYSSQNPASAEAIKSSEARLVLSAERKAKIFGGAWEQAMRIAYMVMNGGFASLPPNYLRMESIWADPSTPTYAAKADAAAKLYAGGLGLIPKEQGRIDLGYSVVQREQMKTWDEQDNPMGLLGAVAGGPAGPAKTSATDAAKPTETATQSPQT